MGRRPESKNTDYFDNLSVEHQNWLNEHSDFINQDHELRKECMIGEGGVDEDEFISAGKSLADEFVSTSKAIHLIDSVDMSAFYKTCLYERVVMGRSSKDIARDLRVKCCSGDVEFEERKTVGQIDQAIKFARKKVGQKIESNTSLLDLPEWLN